MELSDEEIAERIAAYEPPRRPTRTACWAKYCKLVGSAAQGAVTN